MHSRLMMIPKIKIFIRFGNYFGIEARFKIIHYCDTLLWCIQFIVDYNLLWNVEREQYDIGIWY